MSSRLIAMLVWGLVAASVVFWALRLAPSAAPVPDGARLAMNGPPAGRDLSRLLGAPRADAGPATAPPAPAASRFRLTGVVATSSRREHDDQRAPGVALISVDGGPVRAYRVGDALDSQFSLWSVALRSARIGDRSGSATAAFVLELPPPVAPATGSLAPAGAAPGAAFSVPPVAPPSGVPNPQPALAPGVPLSQGSPPAFAPPPPNSEVRQSFEIRGMPNDMDRASMAPPPARQGVPNSTLMRQ